MYNLLISFTVIIAILLIIIVLLQSSKGGGLAGTFGGAAGGMGTMFGSRRTADFLSKATWWLSGALAVLAITVNLFFLPGRTTASERESIIQKSGQQNTVPQNPSLPQQSQTIPQQGENK
ncbi:MAG: preprotein translocase subunit SecG [Ignavibacteriaceae bacterium]